MKKIALVLSGGGARGISHIGAIKALEEHGFKPDIISGTSAGAFVGALIAYGYKADEIFDIVLKTRFSSYLRFAFSSGGLFKIDRVGEIIKKYIPENSFESLKIPIVIAASDIHAGQEVVFRTGDLAKIVMASCCLPGIFKPFILDGKELVDGAIFNNLPVGPIEKDADYIVGIHCNPLPAERPYTSIHQVTYRSIKLAMRHKAQASMNRCDLFIEAPKLSPFNTFDFTKAQKLYDIGYQYTSELLAEKKIDFSNFDK
jgi:NTE family protein